MSKTINCSNFNYHFIKYNGDKMNKTRKKYLIRERKKDKKKRYKLIDKLFYQIFFSSICLLILSYSATVNLKIHNQITSNFNFLRLTSLIDNLFATNLFNKGDVYVYSTTFYENVEFKDKINYVTNTSFSGVETLVDGLVINIKKVNNLYSVTIQASDDTIYCYQNLESIDVRIYQYVNVKDVIGKSCYLEDYYQFELIIERDGKYLNYYENAED